MHNLFSILVFIIGLFVVIKFFCYCYKNLKISENNPTSLTWYSINLFLLDLIPFALIALLEGEIVMHTGKHATADIRFLQILSVTLPIYTLVFAIINTHLFSKEPLSKQHHKFFKQLQTIFDSLLALLTLSLLLGTIASLIPTDPQKNTQMELLTNVLIFYTPVIPIVGALKFFNTDH